jgi:hypothetical protein
MNAPEMVARHHSSGSGYAENPWFCIVSGWHSACVTSRRRVLSSPSAARSCEYSMRRLFALKSSFKKILATGLMLSVLSLGGLANDQKQDPKVAPKNPERPVVPVAPKNDNKGNNNGGGKKGDKKGRP